MTSIVAAFLWGQVALPLSALYERVLEVHPLAQAIGLGPRLARSEAQAVAGVWDPTLSGSLTEKDFKTQLYYTLFSSELKVPVWNGLDFKAFYENTAGFSLNPEDVTPGLGLVGVGFSVPVGQGLFIDYRRAAIQKARLYAQMAPYERQLALADLLLEVAEDYWAWFAAHYKTQVYAQQLAVAEERLRFLRQAILQGEATRADTLEASVEVQLRRQALLSAQADLVKKGLLVARHLWSEPLEADPWAFFRTYRPDSSVPYVPRAAWDSLIAHHPKLRLYDYKRQVWQVERRWAAERLRPRLQAEYYFLREASSIEQGWTRPFQTNYKFGLTFAMPLYLRQARGSLEVARLELQRLEWEQAYEARSLYNKALGQLGLVDSLARQLELQVSLIQGLFELVRLEQVRFEAGESDLFVVNRREREVYAALLQLYDLYARWGVEVARLRAILAWVG